MAIEAKQNALNEGAIFAVDDRVTVRVIRTDEELTITRSVFKVIGPGVHSKRIINE